MKSNQADWCRRRELGGIMTHPEKIAYVKKIDEDGQSYYAIYGHQGEPLAIAAERSLAFVVTRQQNLIPFDVH